MNHYYHVKLNDGTVKGILATSKEEALAKMKLVPEDVEWISEDGGPDIK